jgi:hypothetical protein
MSFTYLNAGDLKRSILMLYKAMRLTKNPVYIPQMLKRIVTHCGKSLYSWGQTK